MEKVEVKDVSAIEVKTITIKFGGTEVTCTPSDARKLLKALAELFGEEITKVIHEHHHDWYRYYQPYYTRPYYWRDNLVYAGQTGSLGSLLLNQKSFQASMDAPHQALTMQVS